MEKRRAYGWKVRELLHHLGRYYAPFSTPQRPRPRDVDELIETVGLGERASAKIASLSGGERRRLDVAIGIMGRPQVLFLDEPTAGLDPVARRGFHDLVHRLSDLEDTTILLTTHDLDEAEKLADRILILDRGRIVADGSAEALSRRVSGRAEVRWSRGGEQHVYNVLTAGVILTVLYFQRDNAVAGTSLSLATLVLPGVVGVLVAYNTALGGAFVVAFEREDGTLLRAKAAPFGVIGYITGQVVRLPLTTVLSLLWVLVPELFLFEGLARAGLIAISGIFYPISALPDWLHPIAQVFPFYWLGLGMRSVLLPDAAAAVELAGSWQHLERVGVLGAWAVAGLVLAPVVLRRMARRESGATVEADRQKAAQRIG